MSTLDLTSEAALLDELKAASKALKGVFGDRSQTFIDVGEHLGTAVSVFRGLTSAFEELPSALASEGLKAGSATLEQVAQECLAIHEAIPGQIKAMGTLTGATSDIGNRLGLLHQNIRMIATIAVNARIEASNLPRNSEEMLTFTYEVARLAQTAEETIDEYAREQRNAYEALAAARAVIGDFEKKHRAQLSSVAGALRENLASIEHRRSSALNESSDISDRTRAITTSISSIITALQIADITSQRLAHVEEAVDTLIEGLTADGDDAGGQWWSGLSQDERAAVAAEVAQLQISQIDSALADLRSETSSIESELAKLGVDASAMGEQGAALYGSSGASTDTFLGELSQRLDMAGKLLSDCRHAGVLVDKLNVSVGATFGSLHERAGSLQGIMGIVGDVRLIGLNAYLKADALGPQGRTLSAISRELRSSADIITGLSRNLIGAMDETIAHFDRLKQLLTALSEEKLAGLEAQMGGALGAFQGAGGKLADALHMLTDGGGRVRDSLEAALDRLKRRDEMDARLEAASKVLRAATVAAGSAVQTATARERTASFFKDRYTMASERDVHSGRNGASARGQPGPNAAAETGDLEDIFF